MLSEGNQSCEAAGELEESNSRDTSAEHERPKAAAIRDDGSSADIDPLKLDIEGLKILNRLHRFGHQAYFVGGCVRDLLIGALPKDFDIATSAHPGEVRSLFRNCRLIGRRFRLAHVYFKGGKIIEVSTFRNNPIEVDEGEDLPSDLLITRDNVFGTSEQDALRRDFTVNGLFYDIRLGRVIDFVGGLADLENKIVRTIGNPQIRMREDPVRILRAIRFASKLSLEIEPQTWSAMEIATEDLPRCAPARLFEEVLRLLRGKASRRSFESLHALGALRLLLPPIGNYLDTTGEAGIADFLGRLGALDARQSKSILDDSTIIAALIYPLIYNPFDSTENKNNIVSNDNINLLLDSMVQTARVSRRLADRARQLLWAQGVLLGDRKRRRSLHSFKQHPIFSDALFLLEVDALASGRNGDLVEQWKSGKFSNPKLSEQQGRRRKRRRQRSRRLDN